MTPAKRTGLHLTRCHTGEWKYNGLQLHEEDILEAMRHTISNTAAAEYLKISFPTYKKYAKQYTDPITGKTLFEMHKNQAGRGMKRKMGKYFKESKLDEMLISGQVYNEKRLGKLKSLLMIDGRLGYSCNGCGYHQRRLQDNKLPVVLHFKDFDRTNWTIENLSWLCYNCAFQAGLDPFSNALLRKIETSSVKEPEAAKQLSEEFYDIDEFYMQHFESLGLITGEGDTVKEEPKTEEVEDTPPELALVSYTR